MKITSRGVYIFLGAAWFAQCFSFINDVLNAKWSTLVSSIVIAMIVLAYIVGMSTLSACFIGKDKYE